MQIGETLSPLSPVSDTAAERAGAIFSENIASLARSQPDLTSVRHAVPSDVNWVFARDGSLTAMLATDRWWAGCSVPRAAARFMLKGMDVRGIIGCFLNPRHAAQIRVALDLLTSRQAVVAIIPDEQTLAVLLHAENFSSDIAAGRLWLSTGAGWEAELRDIFRNNPGLPTPVEFVRPIVADSESTNALIDPAQRAFAEVSAARAAQVLELVRQWHPRRAGIQRICLLAPSEFRLWDDAALVLAGLDLPAVGLEIHRLDSDRPTSSSPLALTDAACECDAVLAANVFRSHLPGVIPETMPWITWATTARIPAARDVGHNDRLLLSDSSWLANARQLGWDQSRIECARWPALALANAPEQRLSIIVDTHPLHVPKQIEEYSSQVLLWESIRDELSRDPFLAVDNIDGYLDARRARFQIGNAGFDRTIFVEQLIIPAVQQGLARRLIKDHMPLRVFGRGWDTIDGLAAFHGGPVGSQVELLEILSQSTAIIDVWPWHPGHPIESAGRPLIRTKRLHDFLSDVRHALNGTLHPPKRQQPELSAKLIAGMTRSCAL